MSYLVSQNESVARTTRTNFITLLWKCMFIFCFSFRFEPIINEPKAKAKIKPKANKLISENKTFVLRKR